MTNGSSRGGSQGGPLEAVEDLWWGVFTSAAQIEGSAASSDTAVWERSGRFPPSGNGNGFADRFADDFALMADLGFTNVRLTLDWSRLEPMEGITNPAAIDRYETMLAAAGDAGLSVWAGVHHRSTPQWFVDLGDFTNSGCRQYHWVRHLDRLADRFGDSVAGWIGIHHPVGTATEGWYMGLMPPGRSAVPEFTAATEALLLANHDVWLRLRGTGVPVACDMNLSLFVPTNDPANSGGTVGGTTPGDRRRSDDPMESAADLYRQTLWDSWIDLLAEGVLRLPGRQATDVPEAAGSFDFVGFSYYAAIAVSPDGSYWNHPPDAPTDSFNRSMWAPGLGTTLRTVATRLPDKPLLITSTGVVSGDDDLRARTLDAYFTEAHRVRSEGVDLRGIFVNTAIDAWEWYRGFDVHFGFADIDRRLRPSAETMRAWTSGRNSPPLPPAGQSDGSGDSQANGRNRR